MWHVYVALLVISIKIILENVALRKNAWQLHPYENPYLRDSMNASKAVDGLKTDLSSSGHQCTLSANFKDQALLSVDLGRVFGIHHITIYYRTDNVPWGKYLKVYFCCCCCWEDPSSGEFNIRKVKHCPVTSKSQSSQVWRQVGPLLKPSVENMSVS